MAKKEKNRIQMDCILYDGIYGKCRGLKQLYCQKEGRCGFYKDRSNYHMDGTRKEKKK